MEKVKMERINFLAKKSKAEGLSEEEKIEQQILRKEYILAFRNNLSKTLETVYILDEAGNKIPLPKKDLQ